MPVKRRSQKPVVTGPGITLRPNPLWPGTVYPVRITEESPEPPRIAEPEAIVPPTQAEMRKEREEISRGQFPKPEDIVLFREPVNPPPPSPENPAGYDGIHPTAIVGPVQMRCWCAFATVLSYTTNSAHIETWKNRTGGTASRFFPCMTTTPHAPGGFMVAYPGYILVAIQGTTTEAQCLRYVSMQEAVGCGPGLGDVGLNNHVAKFIGYSAFRDQAELWLDRIREFGMEHPGRELILCGHSLGGAIAQMVNYVCCMNRFEGAVTTTWDSVRATVSFGSPRCINEIKQAVPSMHHVSAIEADEDPVPYLPYHGLMRARFLNDAPNADIRNLRVMGHRGPDLSLPTCKPSGWKQNTSMQFDSIAELIRKGMRNHTMSSYANAATAIFPTFPALRDNWDLMHQTADKSLIPDMDF